MISATSLRVHSVFLTELAFQRMAESWWLVERKRCSVVVRSMSQGCTSVSLLRLEFQQRLSAWTSHFLRFLMVIRRKEHQDSINSLIMQTVKYSLQTLDVLHISCSNRKILMEEIAQSQLSITMSMKTTYFEMKLQPCHLVIASQIIQCS